MMDFDMVDNATQGTVIKVVGVGGAGGNAVQHMINKGVSGVEFIAANTDAQALAASKAHNVIQIGDSGLGAGMKPDVGRKLAEDSRSRIEDALRGAHMVFIAAGMGGGTGTGAAPVVAQVAKELGALTVAVVSKPFSYEGGKCMELAEAGLEELTQHVDSLIVILNEKLEEIYEDDSMIEWLQHADDVLNNAVAGIAEIINVPGHINVDFNDVKTIMAEQGKAMMGTAVASGVDRARIAAEQAIASPLLDGIDLSGARGVLVLIAAGKSNFKLSESRNAMNTIRRYAADEAHVIYGTAYDETLGDALRVTVIATGLSGAKRQQAPMTVVHSAPQTQVYARTGTDNIPVLTQPVGQAVGGAPAMGHAAPAHDFSGMNTPSVWRSGRTQAAAKVDALASNGMDEIEIPAFLRKQAD